MLIHVCFSSDDNYVQHLAVAMTSILFHQRPEDELVFWILDGGILYENKKFLENIIQNYTAQLHFVKVDASIFALAPIQTLADSISHVSYAAYYRLIISSLLPELDRIIYLDCDLICRASLSDLYNEYLGDDWIRGVVDIDVEKHTRRLSLDKYICSGVLLLNLHAWRRNGVEKLCFDFINDYPQRIVFHDQDVLNVVCQEHLSYLEPTWDAQACDTHLGKTSGFNNLAKTANIVHFIGGRKPWQPGCHHPFRKEYFYYLRMTPYRHFEYGYLWKRICYFLSHTKYSHGRKRWYIFGIKIWQKNF